MLMGTFDPELDSPISPEELNTAVCRCKDGKAPGEDLIPYEFFKNLPEEGIKCLCHIFNAVLESGTTPLAWSRIKVTLLFKKGDTADPANYRGISLINSMTKILTQILNNRLSAFAESRLLIPENQNGFRKARGTADSIFTLASVVSIATRHPGRKLFTAFIDFRRAFDSVSHVLLWRKLGELGVSARFLRVIRSLYDNASFSVLIGDKSTKQYPISEGILQGDILSPLLFALFISDFDKFLVQNDIRGVSINSLTEITSLFYADDLALLADSYAGMRRLLRVLHLYCEQNELTVNSSKSKVIVFQRKGRPKSYEFPCGNANLEVVSSFCFLGVRFSRSGLFSDHAKLAIQKGVAAYKAIWSVVFRSGVNSPASWKTLFGSAIASTALYSCETWGFYRMDALERIQVRAFKALLGLAWSTPDCLVRTELGLAPMELSVARSMFDWWAKLMAMDAQRLPRICFDRLVELAHHASDHRYNWVLQLQTLFEKASCGSCMGPVGGKLKELRTQFLTNIEKALREKDVESANQSRYNHLPCNPNALTGQCSGYLDVELPFSVKRSLAQVRTIGDRMGRLTLDRLTSSFSNARLCQVCNLGSPDTLCHLVGECAVFRVERGRFLGETTLKMEETRTICSLASPSKLLGFLRSVLRIRMCALSDGSTF
ncbi:hypothetical protein GE061_009115 [Apolygus lucorum]|uniref:Reverse transcriptase domain-containing protein n=1 Tax=Apolygus lucorum TaxID=248454 RepID=A0A8S9Y3F4_APOLU|nr:hypothetical protein GE061_009115 [Apolygus lucorum]